MKSKNIDNEEQLTLNFDVDSGPSMIFSEKAPTKADVVCMFSKRSAIRTSSQSPALKRILEKAEKISW